MQVLIKSGYYIRYYLHWVMSLASEQLVINTEVREATSIL